jgi:hypothetical protein
MVDALIECLAHAEHHRRRGAHTSLSTHERSPQSPCTPVALLQGSALSFVAPPRALRHIGT